RRGGGLGAEDRRCASQREFVHRYLHAVTAELRKQSERDQSAQRELRRWLRGLLRLARPARAVARERLRRSGARRTSSENGSTKNEIGGRLDGHGRNEESHVRSGVPRDCQARVELGALGTR